MKESTLESRIVIVGITGRAGSGKDSASDALVLRSGYTRIALADAVKDAFDALSGPTRQWHKELDDWGMSQRRAWQLLGTEARNATGCVEMWAALTCAKIAYAAYWHPAPRFRFVVPDVRFPFEAEYLRRFARDTAGACGIVRVDRPGLSPIAEAAHSSETELDGIDPDQEIVNRQSPQWRDHLEIAICSAAAEIEKRLGRPVPC
jgi:hypothetical protein